MGIGALQARFLDGGWLGKAHFWPSGRLLRLVRLAPDALFEISSPSPSGEFGIPLNHLRFLEWIGVRE